MDERAKTPAHHAEEEVFEPRERPVDGSIARVAREQGAACLAGGDPEQRGTVGRAAHDAAQDDEAGQDDSAEPVRVAG